LATSGKATGKRKCLHDKQTRAQNLWLEEGFASSTVLPTTSRCKAGKKNRVFARKNNSGLFKRKPKNMFKTLVVLSKITTNKNLGAKGFGKLLSSCQIIHSDLLYYTTPPFHIVVGENWSVAVNYSHIVIGATMVISNLVKDQLSQTVWG
jgi:hypothetical protein